ncbi:carboxymuconolactone decarboxylase family protein [Dyadobacter fermentans]|uniref:Alkylhydroperoxidase like protein, AhpD family n=1 Tax=Dyadobacter fermentans (strain ATCC 700827 / DSM 18053 / CIP 107007 / KCTC 52180 / NS114) TaxID=471854 RepID=C6VTC6_DYAFD|nr:carboxymuconolactone decarboxylase family protein [Dyadobacter fermentans]ACT96490.1 alkylhydroperoxidase like protein, AhpD family [Dyadobacter fermentans DSM 18053]
MNQRINFQEKGQKALKAMYALGGYLAKSQVEKRLLNLIYLRVSQINGCAFCIDMHSKDLRFEGETEQRLYLLNAWREAPFYSERERAALAYAEAVTSLQNREVTDEVFNAVDAAFSDEEIVDLTVAITTINSYNRFNIAFRTEAGSYEPGQFAVH